MTNDTLLRPETDAEAVDQQELEHEVQDLEVGKEEDFEI